MSVDYPDMIVSTTQGNVINILGKAKAREMKAAVYTMSQRTLEAAELLVLISEALELGSCTQFPALNRPQERPQNKDPGPEH